MPTLSEKLKSLGVHVGARDLAPRPRDPHSIDQVVAGRLIPTRYGQAFVCETVYAEDYRHGRASLALTRSLETIAEWAREGRLARCASGDLIFLDIETSGIAGGTGTYAFLIGAGRFRADGFQLTQFFMRDPAEEPAVLDAFLEYLERPGALVTFNGKAFDVPILNTRYIANGLAAPLAAAPNLDLLPLARRLWRQRLESRALGDLEVHILGAARTEQDVSGWLIPSIYFDYLRSGDARPLKSVFYHNAMDVVAMAALLNHVAQMLEEPLVFAAEHGLDLVAIARMFESLGRLEEAALLYQRGLEHDIGEQVFRQTVQRLALLHRRRGEMAAAIELWQEAARTGQIYAHVELAKYYEHQAKDCAAAARWARDALALLNGRDGSPDQRRKWQADLEHRLARLEGNGKRKTY